MAQSNTDQFLANNEKYASGDPVHKPAYPGKQPIQPAKRVAVVACMDARLDVEDLLGLQTGDAHIIRNAGGVVTDDAIRCLIISHHLLNTGAAGVHGALGCAGAAPAFTSDSLPRRAGAQREVAQ
jgi:carbonic anhydrase